MTIKTKKVSEMMKVMEIGLDLRSGKLPTKKITWEIPLKTVSEANCSEHWRTKSKRHKLQQFFVRQLFLHEAQEITLPCIVKFIRLSPRALDDDNLRMSMKWLRDEISECLIPQNAKFVLKANGRRYKLKGRVDSDPRIFWAYDQLKSKIKGIRIEISCLENNQAANCLDSMTSNNLPFLQ